MSAPAGSPPAQGHDGRRRAILAIDTATTRIVVASGSPDGRIDGLTTWPAGYRHGETLLPAIGRFLGEQNLRRSRLTGIVVGTGPGAFTGLRVGLATAKGLAHGLGIPIVGVSTGEALLRAASEAGIADPILLLPAGPNDRIVVRPHRAPALLVAGTDPELAPGETLVAIDLDERADAEAIARGESARTALGAALVALGAERLRRSSGDDLARLVPEYVTLPRGVTAETGEVSWSRSPR